MAQIDDLQQAVNALQAQVADLLNRERFPVGTLLAYAGADVPLGFIAADGQIVDFKTNPELTALAAVLGSRFSLPGDSVGACRLPNLVGRAIRGAKDAASVGTLSGNDSVVLALQQLPQHRHGVVGAWHASGADEGRNIGGAGDTHRQNLSGGQGLGTWYEYSGTYTTLEPGGGQQAISVVQASCDVSFIVKY